MEDGGEEAGGLAGEQRQRLQSSAGQPEEDKETLSRRTLTKSDWRGVGKCVFVLYDNICIE